MNYIAIFITFLVSAAAWSQQELGDLERVPLHISSSIARQGTNGVPNFNLQQGLVQWSGIEINSPIQTQSITDWPAVNACAQTTLNNTNQDCYYLHHYSVPCGSIGGFTQWCDQIAWRYKKNCINNNQAQIIAEIEAGTHPCVINNTQNYPISRNDKFMYLEPGTDYSLTITGGGTIFVQSALLVPEDYIIFIKDAAGIYKPSSVSVLPFGTAAITVNFQIREAKSKAPLLLGQSGNLNIGDLRWELSLGTLGNGEGAGRLVLHEADLNPASYTRAALKFYLPVADGPNEVEAVKDGGGLLRQIKTPGSFADLVDTVTSGGVIQYEVRMYSPLASGATKSAGIYSAAGLTLLSKYAIGRTALQTTNEFFIKQYDGTNSLLRTEQAIRAVTGNTVNGIPLINWTSQTTAASESATVERTYQTLNSSVDGTRQEFQVVGQTARTYPEEDHNFATQRNYLNLSGVGELKVYEGRAQNFLPDGTPSAYVGKGYNYLYGTAITDPSTYGQKILSIDHFGGFKYYLANGNPLSVDFAEVSMHLEPGDEPFDPALFSSSATVDHDSNPATLPVPAWVGGVLQANNRVKYSLFTRGLDYDGVSRRNVETVATRNDSGNLSSLTSLSTQVARPRFYALGTERIEILCSYTPYGFPENTNRRKPTFSASYSPDTANRRLMSKPYSTFRPDGTKTSYGYFEGSYRGISNAFVTLQVDGYHATALTPIEANESPVLSAVSHGATNHTNNGVTFSIDAVSLEAGKSTRTVTVRNRNGWPMFIESWAYNTSSQWVKIDDVSNTYDDFGRLTSVSRDGRFVYEASWTGLRKRWEKDEAGIKTSYIYDGMGRVIGEVKSGLAGIAGIPESRSLNYFYDARDRVVVKETLVGTNEKLIERKTFDAEGFLVSETSTAGLTTRYTYDSLSNVDFIGLVKSSLFPDGTKKREYYKQNGQLWKEERLAAEATLFDVLAYSYSSNVTPPVGSDLSAANRKLRLDFQPSIVGHPYQETYEDASGILRFERSSTATTNPFEKKHLVSATSGQLIGTIETEVAQNGAISLSLEKSVFYDLSAKPFRSGLDVDGGGIALSGTDRVADEESKIVTISGSTWREKIKTAYPTSGQSSAFASYERVKLTDLPVGTLSISEVQDVHGSITGTSISVDRANCTVISTTSYPDGSNLVITTVNGMIRSERSRQGTTSLYQYDGAGRLIKSTDSRSNAKVTEYFLGSSLVQTVRMGGANGTYPTNFTYHPQGSYGAGMVATSTDSANRVTRYSYNQRGNVVYLWGDSVSPIWNEYDGYGRLWKRHTYAASLASFAGSTWPVGAGDGAVTIYGYAKGTSLATSVADAKGRTTTHQYDERSRLVSRSTAASTADFSTVATTAITITRLYNPKTDELTSIDYSEGTPDISYTYQRSGAVLSVTDAAGTRNLSYQYNTGGSASQRLQLLGETLPSAYQSLTNVATGAADFTFNTMGYKSQPANGVGSIIGRPAGLDLGMGSGGIVSTSRYASGYGYDLAGRINAVGIQSANVTYGYLPNSDLIETRQSSAGLVETRGYEPDRDLLRTIYTNAGANLKISYSHIHDTLGRRDDLTQTGEHFAPYGGTLYTDYGYSNRDELENFDVKVGSASGPMVAGRSHGFTYDLLGNRTNHIRKGAPSGQSNFSYSPNSLNQYDSRKTPDWAEVSGIVSPTIKPSVGTWPSNASGAKRHGEYFHLYRPLRAGPDAQSQQQDLILVQPGAGGPDVQNGGQKDLISKQPIQLGLRAANESFKYDSRGNLREDSQWIYSYDAADRLITTETKSAAITAGVKPVKLAFRYDYMNRRYTKETYTHSAGVWSAQPAKVTLYYWHQWNLIAEATYQTTWNGTALSAAVFEAGAKYYWGLDWSGSIQGAGGVGGLVGIVMKTGSAAAQAPVYPSYDSNGNLMALFDAAGTSLAAYEYDPFGRTIRATGTLAKTNFMRFATKLLDSETGLVYHNARYYSPDLSRFISQDPIGESGGINLYAFSNNNPISNIDVLGYATYFSDSYTLHSSTNYSGQSSFNSSAYLNDFNAFSSSVSSTFDSAYSSFSNKYLGTSSSLNNDWSNFGGWASDIWSNNILKTTSFRNDLWEPYYQTQIADSFFGNPLSFSAMGYGMLDGALDGLRSVRNDAESNPYDPQGAWTRITEIVSTMPAALEYAGRSVVCLNGFANLMGAEFTPGFKSIEDVGTAGRILGGIDLATLFMAGFLDDAFRLSSKSGTMVERGVGMGGGAGVRAGATRPLGLPAPTGVASEGGVMRAFAQQGDQTYYRVFSGNQQGSWLTAVPPKGSSWAQEALALPSENTASFIQQVLVPSGTQLQRSRALPAFGRGGGAEQFKLLEYIPRENFGSGVPFR